MKRFVFRAQAALDLRRREDEEARRLLGVAQRAVRAAEDRLEAARTALTAAMQHAREAAADPTTAATLPWHRNWIKGQQVEIGRRTQALSDRRDEQTAASAHALQTRRRLRSLEKLRERMWQRHQHEERREEQKALDLFGSLQYAARAIAERRD